MERCPPQRLNNYLTTKSKVDSLHAKATGNPGCQSRKCMGSMMRPPPDRPGNTPRSVEELREQAQSFIQEYYDNQNKLNSNDHNRRLKEILDSIDKTGSYDLTYDELCFGAKLGWRNAPRCIGRIQWKNLKIIDGRDVKTARDMYNILLQHVEYAYNGGNIRSCITVFPKRTNHKEDFRVWNAQLMSFAGYRKADGTVIGDPAYVDFTQMCMKLGWKGEGTEFDVLPWVLQAKGGYPEFFDVPKELVFLVKIKHPTLKWFKDLNLKWYCVPAVANMLFDCGGIEFPAAPFNGWYMGTEVGSRDLAEASRYNITERVGRKMGLDVGQNVNLWKDKVLVEINIAVLHSYRAAGVTMVDHHTASEQFMSHLETEHRVRGGCPADWVWIVPPMSSSITPVFHTEMLYYKLKPAYEYQTDLWRTYKFGDEVQRENKLTVKIISKAILFSTRLMLKALKKRVKCTILYATETGKSFEYATQMQRIASCAFHVKLICMEDYDQSNFAKEQLVFIIASTFGNGDPPQNGWSFYENLKAKTHKVNSQEKLLANIRYSVFALGSSAYPAFCAFGENVDHDLEVLGGQRVNPLVKGDELQGQEESFNAWAIQTFKSACESYKIDSANILNSNQIMVDNTDWEANVYDMVPHKKSDALNVKDGLAQIHKKRLSSVVVQSISSLESKDKQKKTAFIQFKTTDDTGTLDYQPGDHIAVYPVNKKNLVNNILKKVSSKTSPDANVRLQRKSKNATQKDMWQEDKRLPRVISLRTALTYYLDITSPPSQHMLSQYAKLATANQEKTSLEKLAKDGNAYTQWRFMTVPNLMDILTMFPSIKLEASFLITQLPLLQPRYYSISSSPSSNLDSVHLTAAVVTYKTVTGVKKDGLCSTWLSQLKKGDVAVAFVRSAPHFHMPEDRSEPVIMVGPGTGIAPLRSFWQQRAFEKSQSQTVGVLSLYSGCRYANGDNLYKDEKKQLVNSGVMNEYLALSREPGVPKTYVQHLLKKNGREVYQDLIDKNGHIYVCGDVEMAADVKSTIQGIIAEHGEMTSEKAKETLETLRTNDKYHEDIFGTLKAPKVTLPTSTEVVITPPVRGNSSEDSDDELPQTCAGILRPKKKRAVHPITSTDL